MNNVDGSREAPVTMRVSDLSVTYRRRERAGPGVAALNGITFEIHSGETLGIVGESGCGKTTLVRALARLLVPTAGKITLGEIDVLNAQGRELREFRRHLQVVFQDPRGSLDPRMRLAEIISEPLRLLTGGMHKGAIQSAVFRSLDQVGLPRAFAIKYPHECSGGQCQRVGIARATIIRPRLVICDEAVSALDVSVQAQIINLLLELQTELNMAMLFIGHNLPIVRHVSHRIAVMRGGRIVELGEAEQVCGHARHPYTRELLRSSYL